MHESKHPEARKLYENVKKQGGAQLAEAIAFGVDLPVSPAPAEKAAWIKHICAGLEQNFDPDTVKSIRAACHCDNYMEDNKRWIKDLYDASSGLPDFVDKMNEKGARWHLKDGVLYTTYHSCSCPMLEGTEALTSKTWCQCSIGFGKELFRHVFGREVEIEVLETIKTGAKECLVKIWLAEE